MLRFLNLRAMNLGFRAIPAISGDGAWSLDSTEAARNPCILLELEGQGFRHLCSSHYKNYKRDTWLGKQTEGYELIAVAGTHGKSTTTAMLSVVHVFNVTVYVETIFGVSLTERKGHVKGLIRDEISKLTMADDEPEEEVAAGEANKDEKPNEDKVTP